MSNVVTFQNPHELILAQESLFNNALTSNSIKWQKESQFAIQQISKNDFSLKTAMNNQASLQNAIINVAAIGISLNPANKHAYLVPRDNSIVLDVSYMGLISIALSNSDFVAIEAKLVYESDTYQNNGAGNKITHTTNTFSKDKGAIVGAYCTALKIVNGREYWFVEEMSREELDKVKNTSKAKNGPWKTWESEMMRKSVVKRASKYWQCGALNAAIDVINEHEGLYQEEPQTFNSYDPKNKKYLDECLKNNNNIGIALLNKSVDENEWISLYGSFERGNIGKSKELMNSLLQSGNDYIKSYIPAFRDSAGDELGTMELVQEIDTYCGKLASRVIDAILEQCDNEIEMYARGVINNYE